MSNYYAAWRSNYFTVKNAKKFSEWAKSLTDTTFEVSEDGTKAALFQGNSGDGGGIPACRKIIKEDGDEWVEIDLLDELSKHLVQGSVAILMETGAEKLRYLNGVAFAVNSDGDTIQLSLNDIYAMVKMEWDVENITTCEF